MEGRMPDALPWYETIVFPALLRHARNVYGKAMRAALAEIDCDDIPRNGLWVIGGLGQGAPGAPLGELVRDLGVSKQAVGQLIDTLVLRGYVERSVDPDDRRKLTVSLTPRGQAAADVIRRARENIDTALLARVGERAVAASRATLAALVAIGKEDDEGDEDAD
jgi:DNA-binding MarR family transcriptional regulator